MLRILAVLLMLAGCGPDPGKPKESVSANQIERLSTPGEAEKGDPLAPVRLQPLDPSDLEREGLLGAGCAFRVGDRVLLAAVGSDAVVKLQGEIRHLVHSTEIGPTGGFFEDRQLSISVGRTSEQGAAVAEGMHWPGRITVTNRRAELEQAQTGTWACGA